MNSEIQETIAEIRAIIHLLRPIMIILERYPDDKITLAEAKSSIQLLEPLLKKLEEHINVVERKNKNG